jgi:hypothetical protein
MRPQRVVVPLLIVAVAFCTVALNVGCFSTIAPDEQPRGANGQGGSGATWVRGLVRMYQGPGDYRVPGEPIGVRVLWLGQAGVLLAETSAKSGSGGVYAASTTHSGVKQVAVAAFKCAYNPADPAPRFSTCCLDPGSCPCEDIWDTTYTLQVAPGETIQQDLILSCQ